MDGVLAHCNNISIAKALDISKMLLNASIQAADKTKEYVQSIGERFEFSRENIHKDIVDKLSDAQNVLNAQGGFDAMVDEILQGHGNIEDAVIRTLGTRVNNDKTANRSIDY